TGRHCPYAQPSRSGCFVKFLVLSSECGLLKSFRNFKSLIHSPASPLCRFVSLFLASPRRAFVHLLPSPAVANCQLDRMLSTAAIALQLSSSPWRRALNMAAQFIRSRYRLLIELCDEVPKLQTRKRRRAVSNYTLNFQCPLLCSGTTAMPRYVP